MRLLAAICCFSRVEYSLIHDVGLYEVFEMQGEGVSIERNKSRPGKVRQMLRDFEGS